MAEMRGRLREDIREAVAQANSDRDAEIEDSQLETKIPLPPYGLLNISSWGMRG